MAIKTPKGLQVAGRLLWQSVCADFDLDQHELLLLENAARTADLCAELQSRIDSDGAVLESGKPHPASAEVRQQRITLARLLVALRVPAGETEESRPQRRGIRGVYQLGGVSAS